MIAMADVQPETGVAPASEPGALPDAPLAMPKQRLEPPGMAGQGWLTGLLRPMFARTGRSGG